MRGDVVRGTNRSLVTYGTLKESKILTCYSKRTLEGELEHEARILKETERVQRELKELENRKFTS